MMGQSVTLRSTSTLKLWDTTRKAMNESREQQLQSILHASLQAIDRGENPDCQEILIEKFGGMPRP